MICLVANKNWLTVSMNEPITSGSVNIYHVQFEFSHDWDGMEKTAVFWAGKEKVVVALSGGSQCTIPWEVLVRPGVPLHVGVYGSVNGDTVLPTIWARLGVINDGTTLDGVDNAQPPTPGIYDQFVQAVHDDKVAAENAADRAEAASGNPPMLSANNTWLVWDKSIGGYRDTGETAVGTSGQDGKSAYQYAVDGGYTGTEEEFAAKLAAEIPVQVQADWSQTEESSPAYIKDKPFGKFKSLLRSGVMVSCNDADTYGYRGKTYYQFASMRASRGNGDTFEVIFDGVPYIVTRQGGGPNGGTEYVGDRHLEDFPFCIDFTNDFETIWTPTSGNHTFAVNAYRTKKIDDNFLPDSVVSDWNQSDVTKLSCIKNKPFGMEKVLRIEFVDGKYVINRQNEATLQAFMNLCDGENVFAVIDDEAYELTTSISSGTYIMAYNEKQAFYYSNVVTSATTIFAKFDALGISETTKTVVLCKSIKKIPQIYLPDIGSNAPLIVTLEQGSNGDFTASHTGEEIAEWVEKGGNVIFSEDGLVIPISALAGAEALFVAYAGGRLFNLLISPDGKINIFESLTPLSVPCEVGQVFVVSSVDKYGIATNWAPVDLFTIPSSTPGSNKLFRLSVDDSGSISATEITQQS